ncbi:ABC transporter ATP-binding protein [Streptomyces sp. NPDC048111]|uniref:ABC transporter ATP-binding protein n=1 Tax=Streptomyces sp. NPDC048111 TaxID=3365500 RepID=UPI0037245017
MNQPISRVSSNRPAVEVCDLKYNAGARQLLESVNFTVTTGSSIAIIGPSGSGKSTLLSCILGLIKPDSGAIYVAGKDIARMKRRPLERHRNHHMGMVFQFGELLPELTPTENVALAALLRGDDAEMAYKKSENLLAELEVPRSGVSTQHLSGGERQRTAVARALVNEPSVVLADEPTGSLDRHSRDSVADLLFSIPRRWGCALVIVTHDSEVAARADTVFQISESTLIRTQIGRQV